MTGINYSTYFWQDDVIRLRAMEANDWENFYLNRFDTPARRILNNDEKIGLRRRRCSKTSSLHRRSILE